MMKVFVTLLALLFWSLVEVHSQTVYLSLNHDIIPNHGYVVISDIGSTNDNALLCITNRPATESGSSNSGGDWFAPDGDKVGGIGSTTVPGFERNRAPMIVRLRRNSDTPEQGIYHCEVEDADLITQSLYVGLYNSDGGKSIVIIGIHLYILFTAGNISLPYGMTFTFNSDFNQLSPQFTFTCISTGGPATTVTWTRDSVTVTEGTETVLDDPVTAQYTHTLNGSTAGVYTCTVANNKPSDDSASYTVQGSIIIIMPTPQGRV